MVFLKVFLFICPYFNKIVFVMDDNLVGGRIDDLLKVSIALSK